jgi:hypothetical protein
MHHKKEFDIIAEEADHRVAPADAQKSRPGAEGAFFSNPSD